MAKLGNNFAKQFARNEILVPHLNTWFANGKFPDAIPLEINPNKEEDDAFHPSSALKCSRYLFAHFRKDLPVERHSPDTQKTFMVGHMYHSLMQWIIVEGLGFATWGDIEKEGDYHFETAAGNPYRVRGFMDVARCIVPNRGEYLVDIKTMNARIYAQNDLPVTTMEKYSAQVKLYLEFEDLPEAIILCVEKDSPHRYKEVLIQRDPDFVDQTMARWEDVADALAQGRVPECTCSRPESCPAKGLYALEYV